MSFQTWLKNARKMRKMRRVKPHIWHVPGGPGNKGIGYIQNYKVGTRSIRQALSLYLLQRQPAQDHSPLSYEAITADIIEGSDKEYSSFCRPEEIRKKWPEMPIFSFVRNPLSRLYSCYTDKVVDAAREGRRLPFETWGVTPKTTFDEFVQIVSNTPDEKSERHFRSQSWFISVNKKLIIDDLGKIENFQGDWERLSERYGLPPVPHKNRSSANKEDYRDFYNKETYQLACERFRDDIELLGYQNEV